MQIAISPGVRAAPGAAGGVFEGRQGRAGAVQRTDGGGEEVLGVHHDVRRWAPMMRNRSNSENACLPEIENSAGHARRSLGHEMRPMSLARRNRRSVSDGRLPGYESGRLFSDTWAAPVFFPASHHI
jgi:hypothetical protein